MNTQVNQKVAAGSGRLAALFRGTILVLSAMVPAAALADVAATSTPETLVAQVSLRDLDLSTAEGMRAARARLLERAKRLCAQLADSRDVGRQWHFHACVQEAVVGALRQTSAPAVASMQGSRAVSDVVRK